MVSCRCDNPVDCEKKSKTQLKYESTYIGLPQSGLCEKRDVQSTMSLEVNVQMFNKFLHRDNDMKDTPVQPLFLDILLIENTPFYSAAGQWIYIIHDAYTNNTYYRIGSGH